MLKRAYRFCGLLVVNTVIAFFITELVVTILKRIGNVFITPPTTVGGAVGLRTIETFFCGIVIGYFARLLLRMEEAKWVWVPSVVWFAVGMASFAFVPPPSVLVHESTLQHFFALPVADPFSWLKDFSKFTLPCISGFGYSSGAISLHDVKHPG